MHVVFLVLFFRVVWNCPCLCCVPVVCVLLKKNVLHFSVRGTRSGIVDARVICFCVWNALWYCGFSSYIFPHFECALILCFIFPRVEGALVLWNFLLNVSTCGTRSSIVEFCVIFSRVWNVLWYCGISCYIFSCVEWALLLWNFVFYFSIYWNFCWRQFNFSLYMCVVFIVLYFFVMYFLCCIKITSLYATASSDICLEYFWSDSKEDIFLLV